MPHTDGDDVFGDIVDASTVEQWLRETLQLWLVTYLAHQERRRELDPRTIPEPKEWPTVSDFNIELETQIPAVLMISTGAPKMSKGARGAYRKTWRFEIAAVLVGADEDEARDYASMYLAAIAGALVQGDPTLGGNAETTIWTGPDDHAYGLTEQGAQRAVYGTAFEVVVPDALNERKGLSAPPDDPYDPPGLPPGLNQAEIDVTATPPEDTP